MTQFDITDEDIGRYVRRRSSGDVGRIEKDSSNGWLFPSMNYEWRYHRDDFEYVTVTVDERRCTTVHTIHGSGFTTPKAIAFEAFLAQDPNPWLKYFPWCWRVIADDGRVLADGEGCYSSLIALGRARFVANQEFGLS